MSSKPLNTYLNILTEKDLYEVCHFQHTLQAYLRQLSFTSKFLSQFKNNFLFTRIFRSTAVCGSLKCIFLWIAPLIQFSLDLSFHIFIKCPLINWTVFTVLCLKYTYVNLKDSLDVHIILVKLCASPTVQLIKLHVKSLNKFCHYVRHVLGFTWHFKLYQNAK